MEGIWACVPVIEDFSQKVPEISLNENQGKAFFAEFDDKIVDENCTYAQTQS